MRLGGGGGPIGGAPGLGSSKPPRIKSRTNPTKPIKSILATIRSASLNSGRPFRLRGRRLPPSRCGIIRAIVRRRCIRCDRLAPVRIGI